MGFRTTDWASKSARIVDFCGKSRGFADFENTVDRGSAVNFGADSGLCLSKRNLDHGSFFRLSRYVNEFIQIISPPSLRRSLKECKELWSSSDKPSSFL